MLILTIRTDKPEAEIGLYEDKIQAAYETWHAHRKLAETIHSNIDRLLAGQKKSLQDIEGIVLYKGPGSFTGLRIGASVANTLAYSLDISVVGVTGEEWQTEGASRLATGQNDKIVQLLYGSSVHITAPKK